MPGAPRILVLTADLGEGHDLPARMVADGVLARAPDAHAPVVDVLDAAGGVVANRVRAAFRRSVGGSRLLYEIEYGVTLVFPPTARVSEAVGARVAAPGVGDLLERERPDVVVTTYPGANPIVAHLVRRGVWRGPLVSAITDLSALRLWAHRDVDVHLITHEQSREEVRAIAGPDTEIVHVRGLTRPVFEEPCDPVAARAALGLPSGGGTVVVSGGGAGAGDLEGAVAVAVAAGAAAVVVLCGRDEALAARLGERFAAVPAVQVWGFTDRMSDLLAAADVLVHSTAGLTVLEAEIRGTHVISYGWGLAHLRANDRAYRRTGLAQVARDRVELGLALRRALAAPRAPTRPAYAALPSAADVVLGLAARP